MNTAPSTVTTASATITATTATTRTTKESGKIKTTFPQGSRHHWMASALPYSVPVPCSSQHPSNLQHGQASMFEKSLFSRTIHENWALRNRLAPLEQAASAVFTDARVECGGQHIKLYLQSSQFPVTVWSPAVDPERTINRADKCSKMIEDMCKELEIDLDLDPDLDILSSNLISRIKWLKEIAKQVN